VLERLAREIGGWALLLDSVGVPMEAVPASAARRATALRAELDRLRGVRSSSALTGPDETVLLQPLGTGIRTRAFLAVGRPGPLPPADRHVVNAAALLLTLRMEQSRGLDVAIAALRGALLRLLLAGEEATVAGVLAQLGQELPTEPLQVLVVLGTPEQRTAAVDVVAEAATHERAAAFSAPMDDALAVVTADGGPLAARLTDLPARVPGAAVGRAGPARWAGLPDALRRARQAAEHGGAGAASVVAFADLAGSGLAGLLDPGATRAFSEALLAPLLAADRGADLLASLRAWLAHHGQWEPAAAQLGVHRHTLRKRIARAEELLGRDLGEPGVRAELWIALHPPEGPV
jgi:purine catabolism regulator